VLFDCEFSEQGIMYLFNEILESWFCEKWGQTHVEWLRVSNYVAMGILEDVSASWVGRLV
jgi:hypothetical protein